MKLLLVQMRLRKINMMNIVIVTGLLLSKIIAQGGYSLDDCVQITLEGKKTLLSAELEVQSAGKGVTGSYSSLLPYLSATMSSGRTQFPEREVITPDLTNFSSDTSFLNHSNNMSAGLSLNQTLYNGGRSLNQVKQAKVNLEVAQLNQRSTRIQVILNVIKSYYGLLQAQELLDVGQKNLDLSNEQVSLVEKQYDLGLVNRTDLLKAKVAKGHAKVDVLNRKATLENTRRVLFNDMGLQDFGQPITAAEEKWAGAAVPTSADAVKLLKTQNPSLIVAQARVRLGDLSYKQAKGLRLPSLGASLNYSANGEDTEELMSSLEDDWTLGMNLSLSIPLYSGNSLSMQQQQAKLSRQKSEYDYLTLLNDLRVQVELMREALKNYAEIIPIYETVVASAKEDLKLVQERYRLGAATILEVLDAQVSLIRSNSILINTIHEARTQEANLRATLGTLDKKYKIKEN